MITVRMCVCFFSAVGEVDYEIYNVPNVPQRRIFDGRKISRAAGRQM